MEKLKINYTACRQCENFRSTPNMHIGFSLSCSQPGGPAKRDYQIGLLALHPERMEAVFELNKNFTLPEMCPYMLEHLLYSEDE